jgi:hypothetical protein
MRFPVRAPPVGSPRLLVLVVPLVLLLSQKRLFGEAHLAAVCTATHPRRPHTVTFLFGTYHKSPGAGSIVPGTAFVRSPTGRLHSFSMGDICSVPHDGSSQQIPVPAWSVDDDVATYRQRLQQHCACSSVLGCGLYDADTGMCTSAEGDCASLDPAELAIECYGQNDDVPAAAHMAWARPLGSTEPANCAYGAAAAAAAGGGGASSSFPSWMRTWVTAQVSGIASGNYEVWTSGTNHNLDPSTLYLREHGQHPCTMTEELHSFLPVTVADGALPVRALRAGE